MFPLLFKSLFTGDWGEKLESNIPVGCYCLYLVMQIYYILPFTFQNFEVHDKFLKRRFDCLLGFVPCFGSVSKLFLELFVTSLDWSLFLYVRLWFGSFC